MGVLLLIFIRTVFSFSQTVGKIGGTFSAPDGAVSAVTISITDNQLDKERTVTTSSDGTFSYTRTDNVTKTVNVLTGLRLNLAGANATTSSRSNNHKYSWC